jgi:hypothetical protein
MTPMQNHCQNGTSSLKTFVMDICLATYWLKFVFNEINGFHCFLLIEYYRQGRIKVSAGPGQLAFWGPLDKHKIKK